MSFDDCVILLQHYTCSSIVAGTLARTAFRLLACLLDRADASHCCLMDIAVMPQHDLLLHASAMLLMESCSNASGSA